MKLFYSTASPFARKVIVCADEAGVLDQINVVSTLTTPVDRNQDIVAANPTGKIPTLVLDNGDAVFDSRVICEYIDGLGRGATLFPVQPEQKLPAQTLHALGDAIMDASILVRYEQFIRPAEYQWEPWISGQSDKIMSSLKFLEDKWISKLNGPINIGHVSLGCALGYLDFREVCSGWRTDYGKLAGWYENFSARESMKASEPA